MQLFHFWSCDVHPVQNLLLCTKFHENRMIFRRDMAAVRHLGIVLPPYETTHEVSVAGRSRLSNFMSMWYTDLKICSYLNFSYIWLEMPIQAPKMGVLRNFGPVNVIIHHRDPQKGTPLRKSASFKLSTVHIHTTTHTQCTRRWIYILSMHSIGQTTMSYNTACLEKR